MAVHKYVTIGGTVYFHFALNDTSGSGADGATPLFKVRLCGAAAGAAPMLSGTPTLLTEGTYSAGAFEIAIVASVANGFADGSSYAVFCTALVSAQNPTGFAGSFDIQPVVSDVRLVNGATFTPATTLQVDLTQVIGDTQTAGTVGAALLGMEAQSVGKWTIVGTTLTLFRSDGTTIVRSFTLDSATLPTSRT